MKTKIIKINSSLPEKDKIKYAAKIVINGGLVAFPTETVYGIACAAQNEKAIQTLYNIKKRTTSKPFTVHIVDTKIIQEYGCQITEQAEKIINTFWPGPVTVILKQKKGEISVGFRMPANTIAYELIKACDIGIVAPSANLSGEKVSVNAAAVLEQLDGKIDLLIDGGQTECSRESTIVDLRGKQAKILRQGAVREEDIFAIL